MMHSFGRGLTYLTRALRALHNQPPKDTSRTGKANVEHSSSQCILFPILCSFYAHLLYGSHGRQHGVSIFKYTQL